MTYPQLTGEYTIDDTHSRIGFVARHAMVTKVRGSFNEFEGSFTVDGDAPEKSSAQVTLQTKSIDTRNADRDGHLRTNDFLSADEHPVITFTSTAIAQNGEDGFDVTGDLTIKGITKPVTIPFEFGGAAKDPFGNDRVGFDGSTVINRSDFGVTFNAPLETGGVLVSDKITLEFEISAIKNA
ncbi:YceI family protein [Amycolatopsis jiangsuensis]|uniref:Polyisoprenoid-binding protein YceI n=1 Tax=Amycolatopsis jiangsuensis TaxID=1181879 RepID=A0A840IVC9_9PSEU|nr:YceI family protein [Amycolatopsis jiangsuensis]MBB4685830.1 polyisoprenoid-binding protein YceI [Amycolatopsis jiangsuensis]